MIDRREFLLRSGGMVAGLGAAGSALAGDCPGATIGSPSLARFRSSLDGTTILPSDAPYDTARLVYNRRFDPRPSLIVRPASIADIQRTIDFSRTTGVRLAIRSGGHSYIGASGGDGIVLDLASMGGVQPLGGAMFRLSLIHI